MATNDHDIETLVSKMELSEKLSLMVGASTWRTAAVDRLGIPAMKVSDGPSGARGQIFGENVPAAFFPFGVSLGATWDEDLLYEVGQALAEETKTKSASVILAPTMCIHRHPLGGRNFESFSEDPFLTGKLATAHVKGVQSLGIGATPKHFVANDQETNRFHYDAKISPRALREVYLLPFQMVVRDADPWCMMTAYNRVNGNHADASKELLRDIVRGEWGWEGLFMSDWGGTNTTVESISAGLDLEMPGPASKRSQAALKGPLHEGIIDIKDVDASVHRVLRLLSRVGRFQNPKDEPEFCKNDPETRDLLYRAACSGIVMLKNDNQALPLRPSEDIKKLAIVGPNAKRVVAGGGGSSYMNAPYWTSVFGSMEEAFQGASTEFRFSQGAKVNRYVPTMPTGVVRDPVTGNPGAAVDWYLGHHFDSEIKATTHIEDLYYVSFGMTPPEISCETGFAFRLRAILKPLTSGQHKVSFASIGPSELYIDGSRIAVQSGDFYKKGTLFFTYGSEEYSFYMDLEQGREYAIRVDYRSHDRQLVDEYLPLMDPMEDKFQGIRLGYEEADQSDLPQEAASLASDCDAAIVVVGRDKEWETEGQDIPQFELPGEQVRLIKEVARACKRTIVVVQAGTPVQMDWLDDVSAVLYTWYQGQELGNVSAAVITGAFNPSGRLPVTFPRRIEDCPAFSSFPGEQGVSEYAEDIYVGYRWWDLRGTAPLFPLGFGLSYSCFEVSAGRISSTTISMGETLVLEVKSPKSPSRLRPKKQICAFGKSAALATGEECIVQLKLDVYSLVRSPDLNPRMQQQGLRVNHHHLSTTAIGQLVRYLLPGKILLYAEERPDFIISSYFPRYGRKYTNTVPSSVQQQVDQQNPELYEAVGTGTGSKGLERHSFPGNHDDPQTASLNLESGISSATPVEGADGAITLTTSPMDLILVTWYSDTDPDNPKNWSLRRKLMVGLVINYYSFAVYMSSSIFTPSMLELPSLFNISTNTAALGLALFVLGYGFGPLLASPLSEIPTVGRNIPYLVSLTFFIGISIGAAVAETVPGLMILRFFQGFAGSPILATGGASLTDLSLEHQVPFALYSWAIFSFIGPAVGPIVSGFTVSSTDWRISLWEILFLPETSSSSILYQRARRLRQLTGDSRFRSSTELKIHPFPSVLRRALVVSWKINLQDPSILFTSVYCALLYAVFYLFFEAFPLVYMDVYGMTVGQMGLVYTCIPIAVLIAGVPYFFFLRHRMLDKQHTSIRRPPEDKLLPAVVASFTTPVGLLLFAWTSRSSVHFIVPSVGVSLSSSGMAIILQSIYVYISEAYPQYAASLFGVNGWESRPVLLWGFFETQK
ncbi:uncharacterized protein DNG_09909 [Cephalotrichum gorgonifer]|uniref:beta-glucosidase n=1 Tax=Cephalotrichum gorgonifer TaxID=2041049 RepID=A0AAE8SZU9_9PEZI|nr:uncharacterized protein DNG_09909 [Cephalotrichum gorgonifer]